MSVEGFLGGSGLATCSNTGGGFLPGYRTEVWRFTAVSTVFAIMWKVVDAINNTPEVGPFFFPQTDEECRFFAAGFEVRVRVLQQQPVTGEDIQAVRLRVQSIVVFRRQACPFYKKYKVPLREVPKGVAQERNPSIQHLTVCGQIRCTRW